jgi:hypothetical protein
MQRKDTEGSKGGMSKHVRPDKLDPSKRATRNTDVDSLAGDRNPSRAGGPRRRAP